MFLQYLIINCAQCTGELTEKDITRIVYNAPIENNDEYNRERYKEIFHEDFIPAVNDMREFTTDNGFVVKIRADQIEALKDKCYETNKSAYPPTVGAEFTDVEITIGKQKFNCMIKKTHGKIREDKLPSYYGRMALGLSKGKDAYLDEGKYVFKLISYADPENSPFRHYVCSNLETLNNKLVIRYFNPDNTGNHYTLFMKNKEWLSLQRGSEREICTFKIEPTAKDL